ncbi:MAG: acetoacetate decarboxylase family protein [Microthrixaceae bacterium]
MSETTGRFRIEGHDLGYPTSFRDGSSMMAAFAVPLRAASEMIAGSGFTPAHLLPGHAVLSVNCVHYTDTDCGTYEEVALAILVAHPTVGGSATSPPRLPSPKAWRDLASGAIGAYSWRLGVSTTLSRDCGIEMWGYPKVLGDLTWRRSGGRAGMTWVQDGELVLGFAMPDAGTHTPKPVSPPVYSVLDGNPVVGHLTQRNRGVGYRVRGVDLELGSHSFAAELRRLGLPRRPLVSVWSEHLEFEMSAPRPLSS